MSVMNDLHRINRNFMQMCWVVPDLDQAMATWTHTTGVGPFRCDRPGR